MNNISNTIVSGLKFAALGAGIGLAAGVVKATVSGSSQASSSYPASLRDATHVSANDDAMNALVELSYLRYHAPSSYDDLATNMDRLLMSEAKVKKGASAEDRKAVTHWRMEAKRSSDKAVMAVRAFRTVVEKEHPGALTVYDEAAAAVQDIVNSSLHNVLIESSSMIT